MNENKNNKYADCPVCCENTITLISCPYCKFTCCQDCVKHYLLDKKSVTADCMNCHKIWNHEFITDNTSNAFHNQTYRKHRAQILLGMEKSLLPATQALAVEEMKRREIKLKLPQYQSELKIKLEKIETILKKARTQIVKEKTEIKEKMVQKLKEEKIGKTREEIQKINRKIQAIINQYRDERNALWNGDPKNCESSYTELKKKCSDKKRKLNDKFYIDLKRRARIHVWETREDEKIVKYSYRAPCPESDCKGYVDDKWKCGLCKKRVCAQCHQVRLSKEDDRYKGPHVCNEDDKKTAALLAKDTKPCPKCSVPIHRISGCAQVWCTLCHTAFNWVTGKVDTGKIHNPHYLEWQRKQSKNGVIPRDPMDIRCGGIPRRIDIDHKIKQLNLKPDKDLQFVLRNMNWVGEMIRQVEHIRQTVLPQYPVTNGMLDHLDLRVKYLVGDIDEEKWEWHLKKREKKKDKDRMINDVLSMYIDTLSSLIANMLEVNTSLDMAKTIKEMRSLQIYAEKSLYKIKNKFNNQVPLGHIRCGNYYSG